MAQQTDARPSLTLPDASAASTHRPPSPLRHAFIPGIDPHGDSDDDSDSADRRNNNLNHPYQSSSPASSVSQLAAGLAQRVGNFVSGNAAQRLPTDAELEAEAQREREKSRRAAERILTREAEERRKAEERMLAMRDTAEPLPLPPSRTQTMSNPPSPSGSPKTRESWWSTAKNRLTPTKEKEPLTPAQQVILEAKTREKEKVGKGKEKDSKEWPSNPQAKLNDPALLKLAVPPGPPTRPVPTSPVSPTPSRTQAPNLSPSPLRSISEAATSPSRDTPPLYAQFTPQGTLDVHGTLLTIARRFEKLEKWTVGHVRALEERMNDVERWLVEKEKDKEKEEDKTQTSVKADEEQPHAASHELGEIREELVELQGRVGELGREMARMSTSRDRRDSPPSAPSSLPSSHMGSGFATPHHPRLSSTTARESTSPPIASNKRTGTRLPYPAGDYASPSDNMFSPPHSPPSSVNSATRSRSVTMPTTTAATTTTTAGNGNTTALNTNANVTLGSSTSLSTSYSSASFSSVSSISPSRPLPASPRSTSHSASSSISVLPRMASPSPMPSSSHSQQASAATTASTLSLPPPPKLPSSAASSPSGSPRGKRQTSVSPTPRKRYTVALGEPIVARDSQQQHVQESDKEKERELIPPSTPSQLTRRTHTRRASVSGTAAFYAALDSGASDKEGGEQGQEEEEEEESGNEGPRRVGNGDGNRDEDVFADETIGKSAASKIMATSAAGASEGGHSDGERPMSPPSQPSQQAQQHRPTTKRRVRPQSAYDFSSSFLNQNQKTQVQSHSQSRSQSGVGHSGHSGMKSGPLQQRSSQQSFQSHSSQGSVSGASSVGSSTGSVAPLKPRWRSHSIDPGRAERGRGGGGDARAGKFIDPLVLRRQGRERDTHTGFKLPMQKPIGKVPIGDLVAFFDGDKKGEK